MSDASPPEKRKEFLIRDILKIIENPSKKHQSPPANTSQEPAPMNDKPKIQPK